MERAQSAPGLAGSPQLNALSLDQAKKVNVTYFFGQVGHFSRTLRYPVFELDSAEANFRRPQKNKYTCGLDENISGLPFARPSSIKSLPRCRTVPQRRAVFPTFADFDFSFLCDLL
jgi:hypothetical protein